MSAAPTNDAAPPSVRAAPLARGERFALGVIGAVAGARAMVSISPALRFDTDPAIVPGALAGIGPSGSLLLDALGALAVAKLAWEGRRHGRAGAWCALLLLLPLPAFLWSVLQPAASFGDLWRGATWLVAALAAAVVAGRGASARTIIGATLMGIVAALMVRGASQLAVEHPATVAYYEQTKDAFLAARGWLPDSPAALAYERRLRQPEASAWFGLANVNSGVMAAGALMLAALAWAARRASPPKATGLVCAITAIGASAIVLVNGSKGAIATLMIGAVVMAVLLLLARSRARSGGSEHGWAWLLCLAVASVFMVIIVRGAILGETSMQERSLLFRWHYLLGSMRILVHHALTGVGAGGFQEAFVLWRPRLSPEEVASAHSAWFDWLTAFGLGGMGLVALSLRLLYRGVRGAAALSEPEEPVDAGERADLLTAVAATIGASLLALVLTSSTDLDAASLSVRLGAALASVLVAACAAAILAHGDRRIVAIGCAVGAFAMLLHGQVDMDFWLPGAAWWAWLVLGVAATAAAAATSAGRAIPRRIINGFVAVIAFGAFVALIVTSVRAGVQERAVERAARAIEAAVQRGDAPPRTLVAEALADAAWIIPGNDAVWQAAVEQSILGASQMDQANAPGRMAAALRAIEIAADAFTMRPCMSTAKLRADALHRLAILRRDTGAPIRDGGTGDSGADDPDRALAASIIDATLELTRRDPRSTQAWIRLAEVRLLLGDERGASDAATRALEVDMSFRLDPLRQLNDRERERLTRLARPPAS